MTSLRSPSNERKVWDQTTQGRMVWGTQGPGVLHTGVLVSVLFLLGGVEWPLGFMVAFCCFLKGHHDRAALTKPVVGKGRASSEQRFGDRNSWSRLRVKARGCLILWASYLSPA